jgi:hypothetical protein
MFKNSLNRLKMQNIHRGNETDGFGERSDCKVNATFVRPSFTTKMFTSTQGIPQKNVPNCVVFEVMEVCDSFFLSILETLTTKEIVESGNVHIFPKVFTAVFVIPNSLLSEIPEQLNDLFYYHYEIKNNIPNLLSPIPKSIGAIKNFENVSFHFNQRILIISTALLIIFICLQKYTLISELFSPY